MRTLRTLNNFVYAPDEGGSGTGTQPANPGTPAANTGGHQGQGGTSSEAKTYTQADIDNIIKERLSRAEEAHSKKALEKLGIGNLDEAAEIIKKAKAQEEADKTESQKLADRIAKLEAEKKAADEKLATEQQARIQDKVNSAISAAAKGAHDAGDVVLLARSQFGEDVGKLVNAEGVIDDKAVIALVEKIKKVKPHMFGSANPGSPSNNGGCAPAPGDEAKKEGIKNVRNQIRRGF